jgi:hypothetical protein
MKITFTVLAISVLSVVLQPGCKTPQSKIAGNYSYKTECLGIEQDGSQKVKAWANGRNREDAVEQARKKAVKDVLFEGIINGRSDCNVKPVVPEVNAREKYEDYFNKFFTDKGPYTKFLSEKYNMQVEKGGKQAGTQETYGVIVHVLRQNLVEKMKNDGILK